MQNPIRAAVLPRPVRLDVLDGAFPLAADAVVGYDSPIAEDVASHFIEQFLRLYGTRLTVAKGQSSSITFEQGAWSGSGDEAYSLQITGGGAKARATSYAGLLYAAQTLIQLYDPETQSFACAEIEDAPGFRWRGLMLDSVRHFQSVADTKKLIDLLLAHKLNTLHWHLTDDQGWRIEIKRFPSLARISAWRKESRVGHEQDAAGFDGRPHGGFYTHDDVREIVAYAAARNVTIVPEIEMPGHAQAALASFPELSCKGGHFDVFTKWGINKEVFCAGNDGVFDFLEGVLDEVIALFPSTYIHIGADECVKTRWEKCPKCQTRIQEEGLADEHELQSWFIRRMEAYLTKRGRRLIGWDEILEGGLAPSATVMSWRNEKGGIAAAKAGHDAVMTPQGHTYFDYYQSSTHNREPLAIGNRLTLEKVYGWQPVPSELSADEAKFILGGQGSIWTEYIPNREQLEYMLFPRLCALAEVLWGTSEPEDFAGFAARLKPHLARLDRLGVNYRPLDGRGR